MATDPTAGADVAGIEAYARRLSDAARHCDMLAAAVVDGHARNRAVTGGVERVVDRSMRSLASDDADGLRRAARSLEAASDALTAFAAVVTTTRTQMSMLEAIADRERVRAEIRELAGEPGAQVVAESVAEAVRTEVARDAVHDAAAAGGHDPGAPAEHGGAAVMPAMASSVAGLAALGARARAGGVGSVPTTRGIDPHEATWLADRAQRLQDQTTGPGAPWVRMAAGLAVDADGRRSLVVGTSDPGDYLRPGVTVGPDEKLVGTGAEPELAILEYIADAGLTPLAVAAAIPPTESVAQALATVGIDLVGPVPDTDMIDADA